jgi:hypothetical protein
MRPREPPASTTDDLFRARLLNIINPRHELVRLSGLIDWRRFDEAFRALYAEIGRPLSGTDAVITRTWPGRAPRQGELPPSAMWPTHSAPTAR